MRPILSKETARDSPNVEYLLTLTQPELHALHKILSSTQLSSSPLVNIWRNVDALFQRSTQTEFHDYQTIPGGQDVNPVQRAQRRRVGLCKCWRGAKYQKVSESGKQKLTQALYVEETWENEEEDASSGDEKVEEEDVEEKANGQDCLENPQSIGEESTNTPLSAATTAVESLSLAGHTSTLTTRPTRRDPPSPSPTPLVPSSLLLETPSARVVSPQLSNTIPEPHEIHSDGQLVLLYLIHSCDDFIYCLSINSNSSIQGLLHQVLEPDLSHLNNPSTLGSKTHTIDLLVA
ncbi:hypothetical protein D9756_003595 [Leucocoprinus leucothites]|uniref:Uncharacterized protein n=1 Tax=Leucocoprinus leucothites TaxID=201217 RepID=A0A8H5G6M9_9AGAR|nr:hypothetical protein D9756_003595 [Leucoagaricus leucothites]